VQVFRHPDEVRTEEIGLLARAPKAGLLVQPDCRAQEGCGREHQPANLVARREFPDCLEESRTDALPSSSRVNSHAPDVELTRPGNHGDGPEHVPVPLRQPDRAFLKAARHLVWRWRGRRERGWRVLAFEVGEGGTQRSGDRARVARPREAQCDG
jgi:hypothetical protein